MNQRAYDPNELVTKAVIYDFPEPVGRVSFCHSENPDNLGRINFYIRSEFLGKRIDKKGSEIIPTSILASDPLIRLTGIREGFEQHLKGLVFKALHSNSEELKDLGNSLRDEDWSKYIVK